jgi:hypothetical protein
MLFVLPPCTCNDDAADVRDGCRCFLATENFFNARDFKVLIPCLIKTRDVVSKSLIFSGKLRSATRHPPPPPPRPWKGLKFSETRRVRTHDRGVTWSYRQIACQDSWTRRAVPARATTLRTVQSVAGSRRSRRRKIAIATARRRPRRAHPGRPAKAGAQANELLRRRTQPKLLQRKSQAKTKGPAPTCQPDTATASSPAAPPKSSREEKVAKRPTKFQRCRSRTAPASFCWARTARSGSAVGVTGREHNKPRVVGAARGPSGAARTHLAPAYKPARPHALCFSSCPGASLLFPPSSSSPHKGTAPHRTRQGQRRESLRAPIPIPPPSLRSRLAPPKRALAFRASAPRSAVRPKRFGFPRAR